MSRIHRPKEASSVASKRNGRPPSGGGGPGGGGPKPSAFVALTALSGTPAPKTEDGPPCHLCTAKCCKYFALEIDRPNTPQDHDQIRWFLLHEGIVVWAQDGDWYLEVRNRCKHLQADGSCGIYDTRPQVCRDYGMPEIEGPCEYFTEDLEFDLFFDTAEKFEAWSRNELERREARLKRRREAYRRSRRRADSVEAIA
jgi:Fe-S-cluster containining protein